MKEYDTESLAKSVSACFILVGAFLLIYGIVISPGEKGLSLKDVSDRLRILEGEK